MTWLHLLGEDLLHGLVLGFAHQGFPHEVEHIRIDAGGLEHGAVLSDVPAEHREPALYGVGVLKVADAPVGRIGIERLPPVRGGEGLRGPNPSGSGVEQFDGAVTCLAAADVPLVQPGAQRRRVNRGHIVAQHASPVELTEQCGNSPSAVHILHVIGGVVGRHLRQARNSA